MIRRVRGRDLRRAERPSTNCRYVPMSQLSSNAQSHASRTAAANRKPAARMTRDAGSREAAAPFTRRRPALAGPAVDATPARHVPGAGRADGDPEEADEDPAGDVGRPVRAEIDAAARRSSGSRSSRRRAPLRGRAAGATGGERPRRARRRRRCSSSRGRSESCRSSRATSAGQRSGRWRANAIFRSAFSPKPPATEPAKRSAETQWPLSRSRPR